MARARQGTAGNLVSSVAYRPEYYQVHGEINEIRRASAAKNCPLPSDAELVRPAAGGKKVR